MSSFKVTGVLALDGTNFQAGISRAQAAVKGLGGTALSSLKGQLAAAFSVGAVSMMAQKTLEYADSIDETASRLGVGIEQLQEWSFVAKQAGASTEDLVGLIERLTNAAVDPDKLKLFNRMGISPQGMTTAGLFQSVSGWAQGKQSSEVTPILRELTGMKGVGALFNTLTSDLDAGAKAARDFGAVMDAELTMKLAKLNDQFSVLSQILVSQFGPAILWAGKQLISAFGNIKGAAGFWGAATSKMGLADLAKLLIPGMQPQALQKLWEGMRSPEASAEMTKATDATDALIKQLEASALRTETASTIGEPIGADKVKSERGGLSSASGAMAAGNFLGGAASMFTSVAQQQLQTQRRIEQNTKDALTAYTRYGDQMNKLLSGE